MKLKRIFLIISKSLFLVLQLYIYNGSTITDYHTFLSKQLSHDSYFAGNCLKEFYHKYGISKYKSISLWTDGGNHFRSQEFLYFLLSLSKFNNSSLKHNFFGEYHGKNIVDGHFGRLSQWVKQIELRNRINSITHLYELFKEKENERRRNKYTLNQSEFHSGERYFHIYQPKKRRNIIYLKMENIKNYLSFLFNSDKLYGSYFTSESNDQYKNIFFEQKIKNDQRKDKFAPSEGALQSPTLEKTGTQYQKRTKLRYEALKYYSQ